MTVDLLAPLVIDWATRTGRQIVLDSGRYSTRHPLLPSVEAGGAWHAR
jgi:flagellar assembly factor FliW